MTEKRKIDQRGGAVAYIIIAIVVIGIILFATGVLGPSTFSTTVSTEDGQLTEEEVARVLEGMGDNFLLPANEEPVVAVITNVEALRQEQAFYGNADNGDFLVLYPQNARAFIYDMDRDIIINAGPLQITPDQAQSGAPVPVIEQPEEAEAEVPTEETEVMEETQ